MSTDPDLQEMHQELLALGHRMRASVGDDLQRVRVHPNHRASAENLLHYLAFRGQDVRGLQSRLSVRGLSSLGRAEPHVLATTTTVSEVVAHLAGLRSPSSAGPEDVESPQTESPGTGRSPLSRNAAALFGEPSAQRRTRIMVTLPNQAAADPELVERIVAAGAELVRINTAHDGPDAWRAMERHVRAAEQRAGRRVRIAMDLAGPKLRTGPVAPGPGVLKARPVRDELGRAREPAQLWLTPATEDRSPRLEGGALIVPVVDAQWLSGLAEGSRVSFRDARRSRRVLEVREIHEDGVLAELWKTAYLTGGTALSAHRPGTVLAPSITTVAPLPPHQRKLRVFEGDVLILTRDLSPADPGSRPARIGCTLPRVFADAEAGQRVFIDDGKVEGVIEAATDDELWVRIVEAAPRGSTVAQEKGINLPDTALRMPALTGADIEDLATVVELADMVALSFVRSGSDVEALQHALHDLGRSDLPVILKVETVAGFEQLPEILLTALRSPQVGVMIARGDLAVEAGYARMAEVQEEILWLCESAHVPVIWATQVLDTLARTGRPSRAEVTDAAMSGRAECVMLNKGPYIVEAVRFLDDILTRMNEHQRKKSPLLRALRAWTSPVTS